MASIRQDFGRTAQDLTRVAQDAAYVAVGLGVVAFQKAQVARRDLMEQLDQQRGAAEGPLTDIRTQLAKAWKDVDGAIGQLIEAADEAFDPVAERLPEQARVALKQARDARDQLRSFVMEQLAA